MATLPIPVVVVALLTLNLGLLVADTNSKLSREKGALYLEDLLEEPIKLKVLKPANTYGTLKGKRYLGTLRVGQEVTLLAISDRAYRVRGKAQQGQIAGWAGPTFFRKLEPEFVENLKKAAERKKIVDDLIANEEVALGMTGDEVVAALGKPTKRASKVTAEGKSDTLDYITYERVPQSTYARNVLGQIYKTTTYVKVEKGKVTITLKDDVVASIAESENNEDRRDRGIIVPTPITIY